LPLRNRTLLLVAVSILIACPAMGQASGSLTVTFTIRPSVLLSVTATDGSVVSKGGDDTASVTIMVPAATTTASFSTLGRVANNPGSPGYRLSAGAEPTKGSVTIDDVELRGATVIADQLAYDDLQTHSIKFSVAPDAPVALVLRCSPR